MGDYLFVWALGFFLEKSALAFVGSILTGLGLGLFIAAIIPKKIKNDKV